MSDELCKPSCDHSFFLFLHASGKNKCTPSLMQVGVKLPIKRDGESLFGDKRLLNFPPALLLLCHAVRFEKTKIILCLPIRMHISWHRHSLVSSCSCLTIALSFPLPLQVPAPPPRLFFIFPYHPLLLFFCHPAFHFIQRGGEVFNSWLPAHFYDGSSLITNSSLAYFCFKSSWLHTA